MLERNDPKIVGVEAIGAVVDVGADVAKSMPAHSRYRYKQAIRYTMDNGSTHDGESRGLTKPKLAYDIARKVDYAQKGQYFACYRDGQWAGTSIRFSIGIG